MASSNGQKVDDFCRHVQSLLGPGIRPLLVSSVLPSIINSISQISTALSAAQHVSLVGTANAFGDEQLNVDVLAERIIRAETAKCRSIVTLSSEEDPREQSIHDTQDGHEAYTLAFDPLDGSSIIAPNWTVGTIIGIWDGRTALHQIPAEGQIASILGVYGPRTTIIIALRVPDSPRAYCLEVGLGCDDGKVSCSIVQPDVTLLQPPFRTRYFAPANLRTAAELEAYRKLIDHYISEKYTLRYCGGLVPDVVHMLVKGHGVYVSPVTESSKAKLRRLYELAPIALIMECAGARAVDPMTGQHILARVIEDCDERAGLLCGTKEEVDFVRRSFGLE